MARIDIYIKLVKVLFTIQQHSQYMTHGNIMSPRTKMEYNLGRFSLGCLILDWFCSVLVCLLHVSCKAL